MKHVNKAINKNTSGMGWYVRYGLTLSQVKNYKNNRITLFDVAQVYLLLILNAPSLFVDCFDFCLNP